MKRIIASFFMILVVVAFARSANDAYRMPATGNIPGWGTLQLGGGGTGINTCPLGAVPYSLGTALTCNTTTGLFQDSDGFYPNGPTHASIFSADHLSMSVIDSSSPNRASAIITDDQFGTTVSPIMFSGEIDASGNPVGSSGSWSSTRIATGHYKITIAANQADLTDVLVVNCNAINSALFWTCTPTASTSGSSWVIDIWINVASGTPGNEPFNFIAIGKRTQ